MLINLDADRGILAHSCLRTIDELMQSKLIYGKDHKSLINLPVTENLDSILWFNNKLGVITEYAQL